MPLQEFHLEYKGLHKFVANERWRRGTSIKTKCFIHARQDKTFILLAVVKSVYGKMFKCS